MQRTQRTLSQNEIETIRNNFDQTPVSPRIAEDVRQHAWQYLLGRRNRTTGELQPVPTNPEKLRSHARSAAESARRHYATAHKRDRNAQLAYLEQSALDAHPSRDLGDLSADDESLSTTARRHILDCCDRLCDVDTPAPVRGELYRHHVCTQTPPTSRRDLDAAEYRLAESALLRELLDV